MAKGDKGKVDTALTQSRQEHSQRYDDLYTDLNKQRTEYTARSNEERARLNQGYGATANTQGGLDQTVVDNLRGLGANRGRTTAPGLTTAGGSSGGDEGFDGEVEPPGGSSGTPGAAPPTPQGPVDRFADVDGFWGRLASDGGVDMSKLEENLPALRGLGEHGGFEGDRLKGINDTIGRFRTMSEDGGFDASRRASIDKDIGHLSELGRTGGFSDQDVNDISGDLGRLREIGITGGYSPEALARIRSDIARTRGLADTGGFNPEDLARSRGHVDNLSELSRTGGMTADEQAKFRGTGFDEFSRTGGWTPDQIADARSRSTGAIPALYQQNKADMNRMMALQGGYSPGAAAAMSRMTRQTGQGLADATRNAELDIQGQVREGRKWGITGQRDTEEALQKILTDTKVRSGLGAAEYGTSLEGRVADNRLRAYKDAAEGEGSLEQALVGNRLEGSKAASSGQMTLRDIIAQNRARGAEGAASQNVNYQRAINDAKLAANTGAGELELGLGRAVSENRLNALGKIGDQNTAAQKLSQEGKIAGATGMTTVGNYRSQLDLAREQMAKMASAGGGGGGGGGGSSSGGSAEDDYRWAQFNAANERYIGDMQQRGQFQGLGGLTNVYGMDPTLGRDNLQLNTLNSWSGSDRGFLGSQAGMHAGGGNGWNNVMSGLGTAAQLFNGMGGGGGNGGGGGGVDGSMSYLNYGAANPNYDFGGTGTPGGMGSPGDPWYIPAR